MPFATLAAIREELEQAPAHVLHIYCRGQPGLLELEDDDGTARLVTAQEFPAEAVPPGRMPPVHLVGLLHRRRNVQRELEMSPDQRDSELAVLGQWAVVTVLAASPAVAVLDPRVTEAASRPPESPRIEGSPRAALVVRRPSPGAGQPDRAADPGRTARR